MPQTITKAALLKLLTGAIWNIVKHASWSEFKPMPETVERKYRVVYWAAWHWGDLIALEAAMREAEREFWFTQEDLVQDEATGQWIYPPGATEWAPDPDVRGFLTRHGSVSKYWAILDFAYPRNKAVKRLSNHEGYTVCCGPQPPPKSE